MISSKIILELKNWFKFTADKFYCLLDIMTNEIMEVSNCQILALCLLTKGLSKL